MLQITTETKTLLSTKDAKTLNKEFLDRHKDSLKAALEVAIIMYQLDNKAQKDALSLVQDIETNKYTDVDIEVSWYNFINSFTNWFLNTFYLKLLHGPKLKLTQRGE